MLRLITLLIGSLLLFYPLLNHAQSNVAINAVGIVLDTDTKQPLSGAQVTLINTQRSIKETVHTQTNGNFRFRLDKNSSYILYTANGFCSSIPRNIHTSPYEARGVYQFTLLLSAPNSQKVIPTGSIPDNQTNTDVCNKIEDDLSIVANKKELPQVILPIALSSTYTMPFSATPLTTPKPRQPPASKPLSYVTVVTPTPPAPVPLPYVPVPTQLIPQSPDNNDFTVQLIEEASILASSFPKVKVVPLLQIVEEPAEMLEEKIVKKKSITSAIAKKSSTKLAAKKPVVSTQNTSKKPLKSSPQIPIVSKEKDNSVIKTVKPKNKSPKKTPSVKLLSPKVTAKPEPPHPLDEVTFMVKIGTFALPLKLSCDFLSKVRNELSIDVLDNGYHQYMVGKFTDYETAFNKKVALKKMGYENADIVVYMQNKLVKKPLIEILTDLKRHRLKKQKQP